jgi:site-specific DNA-methyltransferase (adenine-specific)
MSAAPELILEAESAAEVAPAEPLAATPGTLDLRHGDCMDLMREFPDKHFDLAIVDPPYGIGIASNPVRQLHDRKPWDSDIPSLEYFAELRRVSRQQIIWGGNYFPLHPSQGFIIWDKIQPEDFSLSMCEYAWISLQTPAKMFRRSVLAEKNKIHPTQKPVQLYTWLLERYAKPGQRILDTHLGSGSHAIACHYFGAHLTASELDADYYAAAMARIARETAQATLSI